MPEPDLMAEASVLAGVISYGTEAYLDASSVVRIESFTLFENQCLWKCLTYLLKDKDNLSKVDRPTLFSAATSCGMSEIFSGADMRSHVETVYRIPVELESVERLAGRLRILDVARDLTYRMDAAKDLLESITGDESIDHLLNISESPVHHVIDELSGVLKHNKARQFGEGFRERMRELVKNPRPTVGIPTGFKTFDRAIGGGIRPGSIELVCSRMKVGKSSFANNIALNVAGQLGIPVLNIDTEMTLEEQQNRAGAAISGIFINDLEHGTLTREQQVKLGEGIKKLESMPYYHEEVRDVGFDDTMTRIRRWVTRKVGFQPNGKANPCLVIYDYFQLMDGSDLGRMREDQVLKLQAKKLKDLMGNMGISCLCFAQQNRDGLEYKDERVIRGADAILDKVTSFWLFCRKDESEIVQMKPGQPKLTHELYYCFSRFGAGLDRSNYINIATDYSRGYMGEGPTRDELFQQQGGILKGVANGRVVERKSESGAGAGEAGPAERIDVGAV